MPAQPASMPSPRASLAAWLRLAQTPGVGPVTARQLLAAFGSARAVFEADFAALRLLVADAVARALSQPPPAATAALIDATLAWADAPGQRVLTLADPAYPPYLSEIPDPPLLLYVRGRSELLRAPGVALVGSRNATAQGVANAEAFAHALSAAGLSIVSGLALGIDAAAHRGGLRGVGSTIAVTGTGVDRVYPERHRGLADAIAAQGCVVSEFALGAPALPMNFPRRNRIISGLSRGVLVVEAAAQSGSLITARMAAEQGREVFAIPGSIHSALSKGCHALIRQGAKLVESAADVLEELAPGAAPSALTSASGTSAAGIDAAIAALPDGAALLAALGHEAVDADHLAERTGLAPAALIGQLLALELVGAVARLPGGQFQRQTR